MKAVKVQGDTEKRFNLYYYSSSKLCNLVILYKFKKGSWNSLFVTRKKKLSIFLNYNTSELLLDFNPLPCNKSLIYRYPFNVPYMSRIKMSVRFKGSSSFLTESSSFFYSISSFSYSSSWIIYSSRGEN